jgi:hypothetical protein
MYVQCYRYNLRLRINHFSGSRQLMIAVLAEHLGSHFWIAAGVSWLVMTALVYVYQQRTGGESFLDGSMKWLEPAVFGAIHLFTFVLQKKNIYICIHSLVYMVYCNPCHGIYVFRCYSLIISQVNFYFQIWSLEGSIWLLVGLFFIKQDPFESVKNLLQMIANIFLDLHCCFFYKYFGGSQLSDHQMEQSKFYYLNITDN